MFAPIIAILLASLASTLAVVNYSKCYGQNYCAPFAALKTQPGTYETVDLCATKCANSQEAAYKFFSYVPSSKQCSCTATCNTLIANSGADSYCINPVPTYVLCANNKQCGSNVQVKTQAGTFNSPQDCAAACYNANHDNAYFNYLPLYKQCSCTLSCANTAQTYFSSTGSNAFKINAATCVI
jgi:hypothetical protein